MNRFLVTGATGFVDHFVCNKLLADGQCVRGTLLESESPSQLVEGVEPVVIEPLRPDAQWQHALSGIHTVIHLAARVTLYLGNSLTIVRNPKDELKTGTFHAMLKQLGITLEDIMEA